MDERQFDIYFSIIYVFDVLDVLPASLASFPPSLVYFTVVTDRTRVLYVACSMIKVDTYGEIQNKIYPDNSFPSSFPAASVSSLTLYRPLEECLARLARGHPVVVAARHVAAHEARPPAGLLLLLDGVLQL